MIAVNPELPAKTSSEFIALAKKQPGKVQYASGGVGSFMHLGGELFKIRPGIDAAHAVPRRRAGHDRRGRRPHQRDLRRRAHGDPASEVGQGPCARVGAPKRQAALPDVPTATEAGLPGYDVANWVGIVAPAGTPPAIVDKLNKEITAAMQSPEVQQQLANEGAETPP